MYEMEGPRPVSRRRPADFSASFAPLDHLPGPATLPVFRSPRSPAGLGLPRAGWPGNSPSPDDSGFPPKSSDSRSFPRRGSELSFRQMTRGFPQGQEAQVFPSPRWLRAFFSPHSSGFPLRQLARSFPFAGGSGVSPFAGWRRDLPWPEASELPSAGWPGVSPAPGGSEFPLRRWRRASPCPKARICPLPWLGVSPLPVARGFPSAGYCPGGRRISTPVAVAAQGVWASNFKILWPSTSHPQLTPGCPPRQDLLHRILHRMIHRRVPTGRWAGQPSAG